MPSRVKSPCGGPTARCVPTARPPPCNHGDTCPGGALHGDGQPLGPGGRRRDRVAAVHRLARRRRTRSSRTARPRRRPSPPPRGASTTVATSGATAGRRCRRTCRRGRDARAGTAVPARAHRRSCSAQPIGVPVAERVDLVLRRQVRAGHVGRVAHPAMGPGDERPVLVVGLPPDVGQRRRRRSPALDGVLVHQPRRAQQRLGPATSGSTEKVTAWSDRKWSQALGCTCIDNRPSRGSAKSSSSRRLASVPSSGERLPGHVQRFAFDAEAGGPGVELLDGVERQAERGAPVCRTRLRARGTGPRPGAAAA